LVLALAAYSGSLLSEVVDEARKYFGLASEVTEIRDPANAGANVAEDDGELIF
jgi:hypothetical protein